MKVAVIQHVSGWHFTYICLIHRPEDCVVDYVVFINLTKRTDRYESTTYVALLDA